jgi:hypothetical protein
MPVDKCLTSVRRIPLPEFHAPLYGLFAFVRDGEGAARIVRQSTSKTR